MDGEYNPGKKWVCEYWGKDFEYGRGKASRWKAGLDWGRKEGAEKETAGKGFGGFFFFCFCLFFVLIP